jgi:hypothetical protein
VFTDTPVPGGDKLILYPNPLKTSEPVHIVMPGRTQSSDVTVKIYTVAFRLVQQQAFAQVPAGAEITVEMKDRTGKPLASGLYYVVVNTDGLRYIAKLIISR